MTGIFAHIGIDEKSYCDSPILLRNDSILLGHSRQTLGIESYIASNSPVYVALDGYVLNRAELAKRWEAPNSCSSAELIYYGYQKEKNKCFAALSGPYSLILFDGNEQVLFFARDALAQRPLYYLCDSNNCLVASNLAQIHSLAKRPPTLNRGYLAEFILDVTSSPKETPWNNVFRLDAGCFAEWNQNELKIKRFWSPESTIKTRYSLGEAAEEFGAILSNTIASTPIDRDKIAISFSGGLDSSALAGLAIPEVKPRLFSLLFDEGAAMETEYIELTRSHLQLPYTDISPKLPPATWMEEQIKNSFDLPVDPNSWFTHQIRVAASELGFELLFTGVGGDELLTGFDEESPATLISKTLGLAKKFVSTSPFSPSIKYLFPSLRWYPQWCSRKFYRETDIEERLQRSSYIPIGFNSQQSAVWQMLVSPYSVQLRDIEHGASSLDGIIVQHPFYSRELVEFLLCLPNSFFFHDKQTKVLLRKACETKLPSSLLKRDTKAEFSFAWIEYLQRICPQTPKLEALADTGWFDLDMLEQEFAHLLSIEKSKALENMVGLRRSWKILAVEKMMAQYNS